MSVKLHYLGQNDSVNCTPNLVLTGDPGTDQQLLFNGGYSGGVIVAIVPTASGVYPNQPAFGAIGAIAPCDTATMVPFATLLNNGGEFAGAIGPSGSKKAPVVRAMWQGMVANDTTVQAYDASETGSFVLGGYLYCGSGAHAGQYTVVAHAGNSGGTAPIPVAICTHVPQTSEPWLGVASLL